MSSPATASPPLLPVLLLAAAFGAMAGGASAFAMTGAGQPVTAPLQADPGVGELRARVEQLEAESRQPVPVESAAPVERADRVERQPASPAGDPEVARRLAAMEQAIAALQQRAAAREALPPASIVKEPDPVERARRVQDNQQQILDPRSDDKAKLRAWGQLRGLGDSWNDAVVATMTHLGLTSTEANVRADVWRQADGGSRVHPVMCNALLQALAADGDAEVRDEAAETLENYLGQPGVREALERASRSDANEKVRRRAVETLSRADRRR